MRDLDDLFAALHRSDFRRRIRLRGKDLAYARQRGVDVLIEHARRFITDRLAPAEPMNDGSQTPMRGHPVFVAQHATATCCRSCLMKWHRIDKSRALSDAEIEHILLVIRRWLATQFDDAPRGAGSLFD